MGRREYTSTPLKKTEVSRLRRQLSAPNFESEESTDAAKARAKPERRKSSRKSLRKKRIPGGRMDLEGEEDRAKKRRRKSRRRRSGEGKNDPEEEEEDEGVRGTLKEKIARKRELEETDHELPIADLLRKAQETQKSQQMRYEEPLPLPELTTDTLYVQGRNGFSAIKIGNYRSERSPRDRLLKPIHVAIKIHEISKTGMLFCQGLLGGIALAQVVLAAKMDPDSNSRWQMIWSGNYSNLISGTFLFLITTSLLAAMDRIDLANMDLDHLREMFSHRCSMIATFPLYLAALCIHLSSMKIGETVELINIIEGEDHELHRRNHMWKYSLCIIAWFLIAVGPSDDFTTTHLEDMQKYAD